MKKRALVSVSDKTNIVEFCSELIKYDYEIIATGNTKKLLDNNGLKTISVEDVTGFPEILDGRVKTLHPKIHGALLALRNKESHQLALKDNSITPIDMVVVNLYPFSETVKNPDCSLEEAIENIDIGGPSMLRSAAKNYQDVCVVSDILDYDTIINELKNSNSISIDTKKQLALKVFKTTAAYDNSIYNYLNDSKSLEFEYKEVETLRYGENPHQSAKFFKEENDFAYSLANAKQLHGKQLSYNNIIDASACLEMLKEFKDEIAVVGVKHTNPTSIATATTTTSAYQKMFEADPISIFGGIIAFNAEVQAKEAEMMSKVFLEIIMAPSFSKEALEILSRKKNIRLLEIKLNGIEAKNKFVSLNGGLLMQEIDTTNASDFKVVTNKKPSDQELEDFKFGEKVCKHVKSNAIILVKDSCVIGVGAGQMNRIGAAKIALEQAKDKAKGAVMISDAFFPFDDTVSLASNYGVSAVLQPGGSIKDQDSIDMCNEKGMSMVFTGLRHFKH